MDELTSQLNDVIRQILVRENYDFHFATLEQRVIVENRMFIARMEVWQKFHESQHLTPVSMILFCPYCRRQHVDEGEWVTRAHSSHACVYCNHVWRAADVPTVGVDEIKTKGDRDDVPIRVQSGRGAA